MTEPLKTIRLSDMPSYTKAELKAELTKDRREHRQMLRDLCSSEEMRQKARRISRRKVPCDNCVYCDGESALCWYPHSDAYMEDLKINPCFEGVLRCLVREADQRTIAETAVEEIGGDTL